MQKPCKAQNNKPTKLGGEYSMLHVYTIHIQMIWQKKRELD